MRIAGPPRSFSACAGVYSMDHHVRTFHQRRAEEELEAASAAQCPQAALAHQELARLHHQFASAEWPMLRLARPRAA